MRSAMTLPPVDELPLSCSPVPRFHAVSRPATALTGDLYLRLELGERWLFGLGDITGHGLDAAIDMLVVQEEIERLATAHRSLASLVCELHGTLLRELPTRRFASLALVALDGCGGLELVNAGHPPPLLRRADGGIEALPPDGPIVGAFSGSEWASRRGWLRPGDTLLLYSDGVTEALSPAGEELGSERLVRVFGQLGALPPGPLARGVLEAVDRFRGGDPPLDDATVLVVGW